MSEQLDMFNAPSKMILRKGAEYARPEPENYVELCIDGVLNSTENQWVLRKLLAGKSWAEAAGNSYVGRYYGEKERWQADPKGLTIFEGETERRIKPAEILARARQYK